MEQIRRELAGAGAEIITLRAIVPSMEDVFMEMAGHPER
jgi:hypothetical protein